MGDLMEKVVFNKKNLESVCQVRKQIIRAPCKDCIYQGKYCNAYINKFGCMPYQNFGGLYNEKTSTDKQQ